MILTYNSLAVIYHFRCRRGFIGQYCEFQDPCLYRSCNEENGHGHCEPVKSSYGQKYEAKCHCNIGYGGLNCEKITRCQTTVSGRPPCENGGQCRTHPNQEYSCECTDSFTGKFVSFKLHINYNQSQVKLLFLIKSSVSNRVFPIVGFPVTLILLILRSSRDTFNWSRQEFHFSVGISILNFSTTKSPHIKNSNYDQRDDPDNILWIFYASRIILIIHDW